MLDLIDNTTITLAAGFSQIIVLLIFVVIPAISKYLEWRKEQSAAGGSEAESNPQAAAERLKRLAENRDKAKSAKDKVISYEERMTQNRQRREQHKAKRQDSPQPQFYEPVPVVVPEVRHTAYAPAHEVCDLPMIHQADVLMAQSTAHVTQNLRPVVEKAKKASLKQSLGLDNRHAVKRAVILKEILDVPISMRDPSQSNAKF